MNVLVSLNVEHFLLYSLFSLIAPDGAFRLMYTSFSRSRDCIFLILLLLLLPLLLLLSFFGFLFCFMKKLKCNTLMSKTIQGSFIVEIKKIDFLEEILWQSSESLKILNFLHALDTSVNIPMLFYYLKFQDFYVFPHEKKNMTKIYVKIYI